MYIAYKYNIYIYMCVSLFWRKKNYFVISWAPGLRRVSRSETLRPPLPSVLCQSKSCGQQRPRWRARRTPRALCQQSFWPSLRNAGIVPDVGSYLKNGTLYVHYNMSFFENFRFVICVQYILCSVVGFGVVHAYTIVRARIYYI